MHLLMVLRTKTVLCSLLFSQMKQRQKNQGRIESNDKARGHVSMKRNNDTFFSDIMTPCLDFEAWNLVVVTFSAWSFWRSSKYKVNKEKIWVTFILDLHDYGRKCDCPLILKVQWWCQIIQVNVDLISWSCVAGCSRTHEKTIETLHCEFFLGKRDYGACN